MSLEYNREKDATINGNSSPCTEIISFDLLYRLCRAGFTKLIPLLANSKIPNVYDRLVTEEEIKAFPSAEGRPMRINQQNPNFWTESRLIANAHLFGESHANIKKIFDYEYEDMENQDPEDVF